MAKDKQYTPLHERIQESKHSGVKALEERQTIDKELSDFYRITFESDAGQKVLDHLVSMYLARYPKEDATPNAIMFGYGQEFVIKEILRRIER